MKGIGDLYFALEFTLRYPPFEEVPKWEVCAKLDQQLRLALLLGAAKPPIQKKLVVRHSRSPRQQGRGHGASNDPR